MTIDELYEYVYKNVERDARSLGGSMNPVKKGSVQGRIYITEYETESKRRVRELLHSASDARTRGDNSGALTSIATHSVSIPRMSTRVTDLLRQRRSSSSATQESNVSSACCSVT